LRARLENISAGALDKDKDLNQILSKSLGRVKRWRPGRLKKKVSIPQRWPGQGKRSGLSRPGLVGYSRS